MEGLASAPAWLFYAITGAIVGALLAAIGYGLQKAGFGWGRFLVVLTFFFTGPITERVVRPFLSQIMWSDAQTRAALVAEMPLLLPYLEASFPDDYSTIISSATSLVRAAPIGGPPPGRMADILATIRKKYAPFIKFADDASLKAILDQSISFHQKVLDFSGASVCGRVAMEGPMVLMDMGNMSQYSALIDEQSRSLFQAIRGAIDHPVTRVEATDADWEIIGANMVSLGATADHFRALEAISASDPLTCPALILFMKGMNIDGAPGATRASFVAESSAG